jgi:acetyl esterase/lipase
MIQRINRASVCACVAFSLLFAPASRADQPLVLPLWSGDAPGDSRVGEYGPIGEEHFRRPEDSPTQDARWLTAVTKPTITIFRPPREKNLGMAVIICPGGGYWNLAWDLEGEEVAAWLVSEGITGIVLKYRVPRRKGTPEALPSPLPLMDAQRAISLVRSRAKEWEIDPNRIGIAGFSAGGHLAIAAATSFPDRSYSASDEVDQVSSRPDFAVAVYPGYLTSRETGQLDASIHIPARTPPVLLVHASDDAVSSPENSAVMYLALKRIGIPAELHIYAAGGHGFGVRKTDKPVSAWTGRCLDWLRNQGLLK